MDIHPPAERIRALLATMSLAEKLGQLTLVNGGEGRVPEELRRDIRDGRVGAVLNEVDPDTVRELQRIAREESRLGLPLLVGRDVIHGFRTIFPIPLGQAASWNPELVEECARHSAAEAAAVGVNWTFAPMVDIGRDPRWGRVAETLGEDPLLAGTLGAAMVRGFQGADLAAPERLAACAKHFAGYGASESGRDYNSCSIPEIELRATHFPPFQQALQAGVATLMASFSDLNGVPASANEFLLRQVLRREWGFEGFVVSDWESVGQLVVHGLVADGRGAARAAAGAGLDMEMASTTLREHGAALLEAGELSLERLDEMVAAVLGVKLRLGLLDGRDAVPAAVASDPAALDCAYRAAVQGTVLLKNDNGTLPLHRGAVRRLAVIGPLADEPAEQLGTWVFDGDPARSVTPLQALRQWESESFTVHYARGLETSRERGGAGMAEAVRAARRADVALLFLGEEAILSGEAHCRADIRLPGAQEELVRQVAATGTPTVLVLLAGRPLALQEVVDHPGAILCAWHPGSLAGPALRDLLFGLESPSGRLPATFPRLGGQIPIYYSQKNTGRPADPATFLSLDQIPRGATQHSVGNTSHHLDAGYTPLFPFGHGLSYTSFEYSGLRLDTARLARDGALGITLELRNTGSRAGAEVVQLYVRDLVGSVTRPVRELKAFRREVLAPGECRTVRFVLPARELAFVDRSLNWVLEPGAFRLWVGGSSVGGLEAEFELA
ncbi:MAG: glycoside hydrolase family 3 N-terminal domain-containing protein [Candidatus Delongbacteria bacterium]